MAYNVVTETLLGESAGVCTWGSHKSKEAFDKWYAGNMSPFAEAPFNGKRLCEVYKIVAEGCTEKEAIDICSSPKNNATILNSYAKEFVDTVKKIDRALGLK